MSYIRPPRRTTDRVIALWATAGVVFLAIAAALAWGWAGALTVLGLFALFVAVGSA